MIAGAQQILAGGRQDRERLLMDRYRRGTESEQELGVRRRIPTDAERQNEKLERLRQLRDADRQLKREIEIKPTEMLRLEQHRRQQPPSLQQHQKDPYQ